MSELRETLLGWKTEFQCRLTFAERRLSEAAGTKAYFGIAEVLSPLRDIDKWIRRKLRCYIWKQWGRAGYRELRKRGVTVREA